MVFSFASFLFLLPRALMKYPKTSDSGMVCCPKSGAKVGIKKTSLEYRDSFGNDGTISGFSVLNQTSNTFKDFFDEFFDTRFIVGVSGFYLSLSDDAADGHCSVSHM